MQSIELLFDAATEETLRAEWRTLEEAGVPTAMRNTSPSNRPHITLLVAPSGLDSAATGISAAAAAALPLPVHLAGFTVFPSRRGFILTRAVTPTVALLRLQSAAASAALPHAALLTTAEPDGWTPHATIGRRLEPHHLGAALGLVQAPLAATAVAARLWDGIRRTETRLFPPGRFPAPAGLPPAGV